MHTYWVLKCVDVLESRNGLFGSSLCVYKSVFC